MWLFVWTKDVYSGLHIVLASEGKAEVNKMGFWIETALRDEPQLVVLLCLIIVSILWQE